LLHGAAEVSLPEPRYVASLRLVFARLKGLRACQKESKQVLTAGTRQAQVHAAAKPVNKVNNNYRRIQMQKRRIVIKAMSAAGFIGATGVSTMVWAAVKKIDLKDPQAVALGYVDDTTKADAKKYPKHEKSQVCSNCQFYQTAQEENKVAPCAVLANKGVAAQGWCSAWAKKPA
jgi:hypothetical protein